MIIHKYLDEKYIVHYRESSYLNGFIDEWKITVSPYQKFYKSKIIFYMALYRSINYSQNAMLRMEIYYLLAFKKYVTFIIQTNDKKEIISIMYKH